MPAEKLEPSMAMALQFDQLCSENDLSKQDVAAEMGVTPSYLSQLVRRHPKAHNIERLTEAINTLLPRKSRIKPHYFDRYVAIAAVDLIANDSNAASTLRDVIYTMTHEQRATWLARLRA